MELITAILSKLGDKLDKITLSLTQFTVLSLSLALGALVIAFKRQGTALHQAQVELLVGNLRLVDKTDQEAVSRARTRLTTAIAAYKASAGSK